MIETTTTKRIRYSEIDKMGFLYYGRYAQLYEIGRAELIRELGVTYKSMEDEYKIMMPVIHLECRYKFPAYYDDLLSIKTILRDMPSRLITFDHEITNQDGKFLNSGTVKLYFVNTLSGKIVSCPSFLKELITPYF